MYFSDEVDLPDEVGEFCYWAEQHPLIHDVWIYEAPKGGIDVRLVFFEGGVDFTAFEAYAPRYLLNKDGKRGAYSLRVMKKFARQLIDEMLEHTT